MGCANTREIIESQMLKLRLRRIDIKKEREDKCKELSKITGKNIIYQPIKDYFIYPEEKQKNLNQLNTQLKSEPRRRKLPHTNHNSMTSINHVCTKSSIKSIKDKKSNRRFKSCVNVRKYRRKEDKEDESTGTIKQKRRHHHHRDDDDYRNRKTDDYYNEDSSDDSSSSEYYRKRKRRHSDDYEDSRDYRRER